MISNMIRGPAKMFGVTTAGDIRISPARIHFEETRIDASFGVTPRVMIAAINLMERKLVDPTKIVTHKYSLKR